MFLISTFSPGPMEQSRLIFAVPLAVLPYTVTTVPLAVPLFRWF